MGNVEIALSPNGWSGDFKTDATGDLVLSVDIPSNPVATKERVYRLLMSNPRFYGDSSNAPISVPSDLFAPGYGAGLRALTGQMMTSTLIGEIESSIYSGLQSDPTILSSPAAQVTVQNVGNGVLQVSVSCTAVSGEVITIPSLSLSMTGG
jgi:hypothetical protein